MSRATREAQQKVNAENSDLATFLHNFFYLERLHSNGLFSGGRAKLKQIQAGIPPIVLKKRGSPLDNFLRRAYLLLQKYYETIDLEALEEEFGAEPPESRGSPSPAAPSNGWSSPQNVAPDAIRVLQIQPFSPGQLPWLSRVASTRSPSSSSSKPKSSDSDSGARLLDDHSALAKVIAFATFDDDLHPLPPGVGKDDKLYDQFDGTLVIVSKEYTASSGTKRKAGGAGLDSNPRPTKTRTHGWQTDFAQPTRRSKRNLPKGKNGGKTK